MMTPPTPARPRRPARDQGFTLVELMVVVVILAALTAVAIPALTRDDSTARLRRYVRTLALDLQRARTEAIASREARAIIITATGHQLVSVVNGTSNRAVLKEHPLPPGVAVVGLIMRTATSPSVSLPAPISPPGEIRFSGTAAVRACAGSSTCTPADSGVTIVVTGGSGSATKKAWITVYKTTAHVRVYEDVP